MHCTLIQSSAEPSLLVQTSEKNKFSVDPMYLLKGSASIWGSGTRIFQTEESHSWISHSAVQQTVGISLCPTFSFLPILASVARKKTRNVWIREFRVDKQNKKAVSSPSYKCFPLLNCVWVDETNLIMTIDYNRLMNWANLAQDASWRFSLWISVRKINKSVSKIR